MTQMVQTTPAVKIAVAGAAGRMGQEIIQAAAAMPEVTVALAFERDGHAAVGSQCDAGEVYSAAALEQTPVDVLIDFTAPAATLALAQVCRRRNIGMVVGSTGFSEAEWRQLQQAGDDIAVLAAHNMSIGVNALYQIAAFAAETLKAGRLDGGYDIEISEEHHRRKKDAPSGTALTLGRAVAQATGADFNADAVFTRAGADASRGAYDIGFSALRGGDIVGTHRVLFAGNGEQLEIIHRSFSRANYAAGALRAARFIAAAAPGFYDGMQAVT